MRRMFHLIVVSALGKAHSNQTRQETSAMNGKSASTLKAGCVVFLVWVSVGVVLDQAVPRGQAIAQDKGPVAMQDRPQLIQGNSAPQRDPHFNVEVANPAFTNRHPKLLFDEAHLNQGLSDKYADFIELLKHDGYSVTISQRPFAPEVLSGYEGLIVIDAIGSKANDMFDKPAFTDAECDAVSEWVHAGGALLLISRGGPNGSANAPLASRFGVVMSSGKINDSENSDVDQATNNIPFTADKKLVSDAHSIMRGRNQEERITRILGYPGAQSLTFSPGAEVLLRLASTVKETPSQTGAEFRAAIANAKSKDPDGKVQRLELPRKDEVPVGGKAEAGALLSGRGRVVVIGDASIFVAQLLGGQVARLIGKDVPIGMNAPGYDNRQLALNVMRWLTGALDPAKDVATGGTGIVNLLSNRGPYKKWDAPDVSVTSLDGKRFDLRALRGKIVVLNFWFMGCSPCLAEIPELNRLVADYKATPDVVFLSLADDDAGPVREFLKKHEFTYNVAAVKGTFLTQGKFDIAAFPTNMIVDREGKVVFEIVGGTLDSNNPNITRLRAALQRLVRGD